MLNEYKNIEQFTKNFGDLERLIEIGYVDESIMFKVDKFSRTVLANNTVTLLSSFNNLNPFLDTPAELFLASTSTSDTKAVKIEAINQDRDLVVIEVDLTGTTPISLGSDIYCVFRMMNTSNSDLIGTVSITSNETGVPANDSEIFCEMILINGVSNNKSLTGILSVPRNYTGFLTRSVIQADKGADVKGAMFLRLNDGVFSFAKALSAYQTISTFTNIFQRIPEKSDIKPLGIARTGGITFMEYTVVFIHNDYLDKYLRS